jgi:hypothetical protein
MEKRIIFTLFLILVCFFAQNNVTAQTGSDSETADQGLKRMDLIIPDELWATMVDKVGYGIGPLGFTADEMQHFKGSDCILSTIEDLFRDVRSVPEFTGMYSDLLLQDPANFYAPVSVGYRFLDAYGGSGIEPPTGDTWGVDWIEDGLSPEEALNAVFNAGNENGIINPIDDENMGQFRSLPTEIQKLIVRFIVSAMESKPLLLEAYDENFLNQYFGTSSLDEIPREDLYDFASAPWRDDAELIISHESFDALHMVDINYLAYGSKKFMKLAYGAMQELIHPTVQQEVINEETGEPETQAVELEFHYSDFDFTGFQHCEFETPVGTVVIFGPGADVIVGDYAFVIDLGGDDTYSGKIATPTSFAEPIRMVVDLAGNDIYDSGELRGGLACGNHGIGGIIDLSGDDSYKCAESGIGCGLYGTGVVMDYEGDDSYSTLGAWGQAAAHAGVGALVDLAGDDKYFCYEQSQAFGSTFGVGIIIDATGNDSYLADLEYNTGTDFGEDHSVSFAQGTGYGRRADFGDGHSLGGGIGMLIEGSGDDSYIGGVYNQGAGYWWSLGSLEDLGGNDTYNNEWYSAGSAPHFAIGCCVDLTGDDMYNIGNDNVACQTQGCARDGSVGVFIDGEGNDQYSHTNRCAGAGDLNSIALFWDRTGDDSYTCNRDAPYVTDRSYGDSSEYPPFNSFRDEMATVGVFLDTGGTDTYAELLPTPTEVAEGEPEPEPIPLLQFGDNLDWQHRSGPRFWSYGIDTEWDYGL